MSYGMTGISSFLLVHALSSPAFASCEETAEASILSYAPTAITAPASLILSGAGYIIDGTIYFGSAVAVTGIVCIGPIIALSGLQSWWHYRNPVFDQCARSVLDSTKDDLPNPKLGGTIYRETKEWRCPF